MMMKTNKKNCLQRVLFWLRKGRDNCFSINFILQKGALKNVQWILVNLMKLSTQSNLKECQLNQQIFLSPTVNVYCITWRYVLIYRNPITLVN